MSVTLGRWEPEHILDDLHAACRVNEAELAAELALAQQDIDAVLRFALMYVNASRQSCGYLPLDVAGLRSLILGAAPHRA